MKHASKVLALLSATCAGAFCANAEITTGWLPTAAGTYDFLNTENWADGNANGVFSEDWASEGNQVLQFNRDWTGAFNVIGAVNHEITLSGNGDTRTLYFTGDQHFQSSTMTGSGPKFIFSKTVVLDMGGETSRWFVDKSNWMLQGTVQNGSLDIKGTGMVNLRDANAEVLCDVALSGGVTYQTTYTTDTIADVERTRAADVSVSRSTLHFTASRFSAVDTITGNLRVLGDEPSCSFLRISAPASGKYESLTVKSLAVDDGGLLLVRGSNKLGSNEPRTADTTSVVFETAPALVGGIIPMIVGTIEANDTAGLAFDPYKSTFVTYSQTYGLKPLDNSDYASGVTGGGALNVKVAAEETLQIDEDTEINSLLLDSSGYSVAPGVVYGDGTLSVASGMVMVKPYRDSGKGDPQINVALAFANRTGYLINSGVINGTGYRARLGKPITGSAGLVVQHAAAITQNFKTNGLSSFAVDGTAGNSTYTGDTYVQGALQLNGSAFLPNGTRSGDVYVNGALECSSSATAANITVNGLYGSGLVYGRGDTLTVGDNNSDGDFSGNVSVGGNTTVLANLNKIGSGTQRLAGSVMLGSALNVNAGKVVLDGTVTDGAVNVASGAAIGGNGEIQTTLTFVDGAKFDVDVTDGVASCLNVTGAVTGGPVTVNANVTSGKWRTAQCVLKSDVAITATFVRGTGVGSFELRNNGTELWVSPKIPGMVIVIR